MGVGKEAAKGFWLTPEVSLQLFLLVLFGWVRGNRISILLIKVGLLPMV